VTSRPGGNPTAGDPVAGFAGSIAHDYSNLLLTIQNAAELLRDEIPETDPRHERLSQLLKAAEHATQLTRQLQAFGRATMLKPEVLKPGLVIRGMTDLLRHKVRDDVGFELQVHAADAAAHFDPTQLQAVVFNLVAVAGDHVKSRGRVALEVARETLPRSVDGRSKDVTFVVITVTADAVQNVDEALTSFQPRLSGGNVTGTDLRLASVHGIIAQSGAEMEAATDGGKLTIRILLPATSAALTPTTARRAFRAPADLKGDEVVFVVEDDEAVRDLVRGSLERYGYTVYVASDGAEALRIAEMFSAAPDLLLTDLIMPEVTGRELVQQLSAEGRLPKVLLMSGYPGDEALRSEPQTDYPFIQKPFTHAELARKVRDVLDA